MGMYQQNGSNFVFISIVFHAVLGNFPRDCNVHSVSMHCGRVYVETEMIFPFLENLQIEEMLSFHAS